mgnify:CR=1 FL=1
MAQLQLLDVPVNSWRNVPDDFTGPPAAWPDDTAERVRAAEQDRLRMLLSHVAQGNRDAFATLYDETAPRIYGLVQRTLRNPAYSEETTQEIYLQIWRNAGDFDPMRGSALSWLMTMAHRRAIDRVRSEQSGSDRENSYGARMSETAHDEVSESVVQRIEAEDVTRCLDCLSDKQREAIGLAYYGGLTYPEVAQRLGAALPTVKTRIRDGLIRLQRCLGVTS